jgi:hypothetical protein
MKKNILAIAVILNCLFLTAQTEFDALKVVQSDITGTARYMSMAGAFGALGGDVSAIKDNPAGLGIYRSSEMTGTLNLMVQNSNSIWNATNGSDNMNKMRFNNFSYVKATPTYNSEVSNIGLLSSNWSFSFNRLKSFDRNSTIKSQNANSSITDYMSYFTGNIQSNDLTTANDPYNNGYIPWISELAFQGWLMNENANSLRGNGRWTSLLGDNEQVRPSYSIQERGYIDEYSIGWAGNFSNQLYLGATINLQSLNYNLSSEYSETFGEGGGMTLSNSLTTSGAGFNFNLGAIYRPIDLIRLGISVHSPTFFSLTDNNSANLDYFISDSNNGNLSTPGGYNSYLLSTPWKFNVSAAIIVGQKGLISAEYDYNLNTHTTFMDQNGNSQWYSDENSGMKSMLKNVQTIKIGGEYKLTDNVSLRAGYANMSAGSNPLADKLMWYNTTRTDTEYFIDNGTNYITGGLGYRQGNWYIDLAYMNKILDETFYPYNSNNLNIKVNPADVKTTTNNIVLTVGLKF